MHEGRYPETDGRMSGGMSEGVERGVNPHGTGEGPSRGYVSLADVTEALLAAWLGEDEVAEHGSLEENTQEEDDTLLRALELLGTKHFVAVATTIIRLGKAAGRREATASARGTAGREEDDNLAFSAAAGAPGVSHQRVGGHHNDSWGQVSREQFTVDRAAMVEEWHRLRMRDGEALLTFYYRTSLLAHGLGQSTGHTAAYKFLAALPTSLQQQVLQGLRHRGEPQTSLDVMFQLAQSIDQRDREICTQLTLWGGAKSPSARHRSCCHV